MTLNRQIEYSHSSAGELPGSAMNPVTTCRRLQKTNLMCFTANFIQEVDRSDGWSVILWAALSHTGKINLIVVIWRLSVMERNVLTIMQIKWQNLPKGQRQCAYTARIKTVFLQRNNINVFPWPSKSTELNPKEHL